MYAVDGYGVFSWVIGGMMERIRGAGIIEAIRVPEYIARPDKPPRQ